MASLVPVSPGESQLRASLGRYEAANPGVDDGFGRGSGSSGGSHKAATVTATNADGGGYYDNPFCDDAAEPPPGARGHATGAAASTHHTSQVASAGGDGPHYSAVPLEGGATPGSEFAIKKARKPPRGPVGDSHASFSARLASVTASANHGAARLADVVAARRARQVRRYKGGRLLLKHLQEDSGAKDPSVLAGVLKAPPPDPRYAAPSLMGAMKAKVFGAAPAPDPLNARVESGDPNAVKKSMGYKMSALRRRAEQQLLVSLGAREKRSDEDFAHLWARVQRQEQLLNKIQTDGARYAKAMAEMSEAAKAMAGHIAELTEEGLSIAGDSGAGGGRFHAAGGSVSSGGSGSGPATPAGGASPSRSSHAGSVSRESLAARARQLTEVMHALETDVRPLCVEQLNASVTDPATQRCDEFPSYQPCVDKRRSYMLDMDAYERKLEKAQAKAKDPGEVPHREEQFSRAQRRFTHFSDKLVEDLTLVDSARYELAGMLLEGFVESQQFMLDRQAEVMRVMKTTPHHH